MAKPTIVSALVRHATPHSPMPSQRMPPMTYAASGCRRVRMEEIATPRTMRTKIADTIGESTNDDA